MSSNPDPIIPYQSGKLKIPGPLKSRRLSFLFFLFLFNFLIPITGGFLPDSIQANRILREIFIGEAHAVVTLVQTQTNTTDAGTSVSATFGAVPALDNLLIAIAGNQDSSAAPTTPAGWSVAVSETANTPGQVFYYKIAGAAEPATVTVSGYSVSTNLGLQIYEYSGIDPATPFDAVGSASGNGTAIFSGIVNATGTGNFLFAGVLINIDRKLAGWTNSFVEQNDFNNPAPGKLPDYAGADLTGTLPGPYSTTVTSPVGGNWRGQIVSFNTTSGGCTVTTINNGGNGSLRKCIEYANLNPTTVIDFNIPGPPNQSSGGDSWWRIDLASALPAITGVGTVIDASTQTTNGGNTNTLGPEIEIYGATAGAGVDGLVINGASEVVIREVVISGFTQDGIVITGAGATLTGLYGNYIGTDAVGGSSLANGRYGIHVTAGASNADIGSANAGEGNLVSGNGDAGIYLDGVNTIRILGNQIGTDRKGTSGLGNTSDGIRVNGISSLITIGGNAAGEGNIVSSNGSAGIRFQAGSLVSNSTVFGNTIGSGITGAESLGNTGAGIVSQSNAGGNSFGGGGNGEGNQIANNGGAGISIESGLGETVSGNTIQNNTGDGVYSNISTVTIAINLITGNADGISIGALGAGNLIYHNTIDGNASDGIQSTGAGVILQNNNITGNGAYGLNQTGGSWTELYNNVTDAVTNPPNASGRSNVALDPMDLNLDPLYAGGFTLTECTSPMINMGIDLGGDQPDMNGAAAGLWNNNSPEIGAFETSSACAPVFPIVKQLWEVGGTAPVGPLNLPVGRTMVFLIYVKNTTAGPVTDVRIEDILDETGFAYVTSSLRRTNDITPPADTDTDLTIFTKTGDGTSIALTDAVDIAPATEVGSAQDTGGLSDVDLITIGAVTGQANAPLTIDGHTTFGLRFLFVVK